MRLYIELCMRLGCRTAFLTFIANGKSIHTIIDIIEGKNMLGTRVALEQLNTIGMKILVRENKNNVSGMYGEDSDEPHTIAGRSETR